MSHPRDADCERLLGREVSGDEGDTGRKDAAVAEADADAVRQDQLPVLR